MIVTCVFLHNNLTSHDIKHRMKQINYDLFSFRYDNPVEVTDSKGPEAVMNELYVMNSS